MELSRLELADGVTLHLAAVAARVDRHAVAHTLCQAVAGAPPCFTEHGRPYVPGGPAVSLSHSGALAACAAAPTPVGVDVERERTVSPRLLARARRAGFDGPPGEFLLWWTAREANCKRLGRGFTWSPLPAPAHCRQGTLDHGGERYFYTVCW